MFNLFNKILQDKQIAGSPKFQEMTDFIKRIVRNFVKLGKSNDMLLVLSFCWKRKTECILLQDENTSSSVIFKRPSRPKVQREPQVDSGPWQAEEQQQEHPQQQEEEAREEEQPQQEEPEQQEEPLQEEQEEEDVLRPRKRSRIVKRHAETTEDLVKAFALGDTHAGRNLVWKRVNGRVNRQKENEIVKTLERSKETLIDTRFPRNSHWILSKNLCERGGTKRR